MAIEQDNLVRTAGRLSAEEKRRMAASPGSARAWRIVRWRRATQVVSFSLFVLFFLLTTESAQHWAAVPKNLFMALDVLDTLKNAVASHHVAVAALGPGLLIVLLTLWGGRIFCGWLCPLGTSIDIADRALYRRGRLFHNPKRTETRRFRNWKYAYLLAGLGAIVYGVDVLAFGDPLSLITRTFTFCFYGPAAYIWNGVLALLERIGLGGALDRALGLDLGVLHAAPAVYYNALPALLMFAGIIALSAYQERFWCRNLCPYGALLGLIARLSWLRHFVRTEGCLHCKKCEVQSRMGAYDGMGKDAKRDASHDISECIQCFRCESICPPDVIRIESKAPAWLRKEAPAPAPQPGIDMGRRRVIGALAVGLFWGATARAGASNYLGRLKKYPRDNRAIRPPGALPERAFLSACTRCGECMKVCPTNGLQPAFFEMGLEGLWTPVLAPSIGPCAEKCTACGDICPTGAIRPFTWQDKRYKLRLGLATVNRSTCIAWNGGRDCVVCAEVCPYSAVLFRDTYDDTLPKDPTRPVSEPGNKGRLKRVPTVDERLCTGCGICEFQCPVLPDHAIFVTTAQEERDYTVPRQSPADGFARPGWTRRKERGKDAEYAATKKEFEDRSALQGPGGGSGGPM